MVPLVPSGCIGTHLGMRCSLLSFVSCLFCSQLPLMNQWKDEFKAHSRVKCPNSGCWLEFPSIYGLKYHYQRCQGVRRPGSASSRVLSTRKNVKLEWRGHRWARDVL